MKTADKVPALFYVSIVLEFDHSPFANQELRLCYRTIGANICYESIVGKYYIVLPWHQNNRRIQA